MTTKEAIRVIQENNGSKVMITPVTLFCPRVVDQAISNLQCGDIYSLPVDDEIKDCIDNYVTTEINNILEASDTGVSIDNYSDMQELLVLMKESGKELLYNTLLHYSKTVSSILITTEAIGNGMAITLEVTELIMVNSSVLILSETKDILNAYGILLNSTESAIGKMLYEAYEKEESFRIAGKCRFILLRYMYGTSVEMEVYKTHLGFYCRLINI